MIITRFSFWNRMLWHSSHSLTSTIFFSRYLIFVLNKALMGFFVKQTLLFKQMLVCSDASSLEYMLLIIISFVETNCLLNIWSNDPSWSCAFGFFSAVTHWLHAFDASTYLYGKFFLIAWSWIYHDDLQLHLCVWLVLLML